MLCLIIQILFMCRCGRVLELTADNDAVLEA
jgi:hypothetical protein